MPFLSWQHLLVNKEKEALWLFMLMKYPYRDMAATRRLQKNHYHVEEVACRYLVVKQIETEMASARNLEAICKSSEEEEKFPYHACREIGCRQRKSISKAYDEEAENAP